MNWGALGTFLGGLIVSIGEKLFGPRSPPEPPAPAPEEPGMGKIDSKIDKLLAKIEAEDAQAAAAERLKRAADARASDHPIILPPRSPLTSGPGEWTLGDDPSTHDETPAEAEPPTVRRTEDD